MGSDILLQKVLLVPAILVAFTIKGWVQAKVAIKLGDDTPKQYGRDSLNPIHHIDIIGFILMLLVRFGWTKPMQIDRRNFKDYYRDDLKVRLAGVIANLIVGFIATIALVGFTTNARNTDLNIIIAGIIANMAILNCTWFVLNLLPIPGFDGFNIVIDSLGNKAINFSDFMRRYNMPIFIILLLPLIGGNSLLNIMVGLPGSVIYGVFCKIGFLIFS